MTDLTSRLYNPSPEHCCEACVFGRGEHAAWCEDNPVADLQISEASIAEILTAAGL